MPTIICDRCGKRFHRKQSRVDRSTKHYCSFECRKDPIINTCEWCKKQFTPKGRGVNAKARRFCSRKCAAIANQRKRSEQVLIKTKCHWCKKPIKIWPSKLSYTNTNCFFCSTKCQSKWHSQMMAGENNPAWLGGHDNYRGDDWVRQKKRALKRDKYKCRACGMTKKQHKKLFGSTLPVHHIIPYRISQDNSLSNLITLCCRCHCKADKGTLSFQPFLL